MTQIRRAPIDHPSAWRGSDFDSPDDFAIDPGPRHLRAFERALERIRADRLELNDVERRHFEVPDIAGDIAAWFEEVQHGRGFVFLRGFPVDEWSEDEIGIIYWGIGTHMGVGVSQSVLGDRLGHVMDFSKGNPNARAYRNKQALGLHTDLSEIVAMLSLSQARTGGLSRFCSAVTLHNEILANHPEYLEPLYRGFPCYRATRGPDSASQAIEILAPCIGDEAKRIQEVALFGSVGADQKRKLSQRHVACGNAPVVAEHGRRSSRRSFVLAPPACKR